jgi:uncharacterized protein (DUF362 family)
VATVEFINYATSVSEALSAIGAERILSEQARMVLKPNLVNADPHPITTPAACVEAVLDYCRAHSDGEVLIAEGSGGLDTRQAFERLGYTDLAARTGVRLVDLDREETVLLKNPANRLLREFHMPRMLIDAFIVSIPVLKAHSMSKVTLSMKNLFGIAPAPFYAGPHYRKAKLHGHGAQVHRYVFELNQFCTPSLTVLDATVGMADAHLWGPACDPPVNKILAGFDPVAVDAAGAGLLGFDWRGIEHIRMAHGVLGHAEAGGRDPRSPASI